MTELALLAEAVGVDERTLRRAVTQGTLHGSRPTPRTLEVPLSERRYARRSWPLLAALRQALRTQRNVRAALLFGSGARGTDTPDSDVDVLVDLHDARLDRVVDLGARLTAVVGRPVDVVRLEDAEADPAFLADIVAEARVLVDRNGIWPALARREPSLRRRGQQRSSSRASAALAAIDDLTGDR
jgi:predicted nucleotidyltransferase